MTDNEKRIAIAEICHWEIHHGGKYCAIPNCENPCLKGRLFDPLEDLNAMHEAEASLTPEQCNNYECLLGCFALASDGPSKRQFHKAARQRAEAFLRTIGKWKE